MRQGDKRLYDSSYALTCAKVMHQPCLSQVHAPAAAGHLHAPTNKPYTLLQIRLYMLHVLHILTNYYKYHNVIICVTTSFTHLHYNVFISSFNTSFTYFLFVLTQHEGPTSVTHHPPTVVFRSLAEQEGALLTIGTITNYYY